MIECYAYNDLYDIFLPQNKVKNFQSKKNKNKKNNIEKKDDVKLLLNKKKCRNNNKNISTFSIKYIKKLNTENYEIQKEIKTMGRIRVNNNCIICHKEIKYKDEIISNLCRQKEHMNCYREYFDGKEDNKPNKCPECEKKIEEKKIKQIDLLRKK